jgi:hypothetical protein
MTMSPHAELDQLSAYVDGELDAPERTALEAHLPSCAECRSTLDALRATIADLASLPEPVPSEQDSWALRSAIARARAPVKTWHRAAWAAGAVAAALVALIAIVRPGADQTQTLARAPAEQGLGAGAGGAVNIIYDAGAFTMSSAQAKLLVLSGKAREDQIHENDAALSIGAPTPASTGTGFAPTAGGATGTSGTSARYAADVAAEIDRCVSQIQRSTQQLLQPLEYHVGTFDSKPAFLLFFRTTERYELWVVQRPSCDVLYFAQAA